MQDAYESVSDLDEAQDLRPIMSEIPSLQSPVSRGTHNATSLVVLMDAKEFEVRERGLVAHRIDYSSSPRSLDSYQWHRLSKTTPYRKVGPSVYLCGVIPRRPSPKSLAIFEAQYTLLGQNLSSGEETHSRHFTIGSPSQMYYGVLNPHGSSHFMATGLNPCENLQYVSFDRILFPSH